jgi:hypothetical protein
MEAGSLNQFIKKALEHYDNQNFKYKHLILLDNIKYNTDKNIIKFTDNNNIVHEYDFETLGYFDGITNIWIWSWVIHKLKLEQTIIARNLLNYGLKLEPGQNLEEHNMMKLLLVNSRIKLEEQLQLDVNMAIFSYIMKDSIKFIYPRKTYLDETKKAYVIFYLLIK